MKRCIIALMAITCVTFLYGLKAGVDVYGGWNYVSMSGASENFVDLALMVNAPFSRYIGIRAGIAGVNFRGGGTVITIAGRIGLIEMIPGDAVSPYFTQRVTMDLLSFGGSTSTNLVLSGGFGIEFLSKSPVSPFIEGRFDFTTMSAGGISVSGIGIGAGGGLRFGATKHKETKKIKKIKEIEEIKEKEIESEL